ncbi:MAG: putative nucleotidyltransferase substrate binding domain-containing protein [Bacteroidota bacterium]
MALSIAGQVAERIASTAPFDALSDEELAALTGKMTLEIYRPGEVILQQGEDIHRALYFVADGLVRLTEAENDKLVNMVGEGATFGSYGLLQGGALPFEARAVEQTTCALISAESFQAIRKSNGAFAHFFDDDLKRYVRSLDVDTDAQGAFLLFDVTLGRVVRDGTVAVSPETTIREAVQQMCRGERDAFVVVQDGTPVGVVTEGDVAEKVVGGGGDAEAAVMTLVERPPIALTSGARLFDAVRTMMAHRIRRVVVTDAEGRLAGLVSSEDVAHVRGLDPVATSERLERSPSLDDLASIRGESLRRLGRLASQGVQSEDLLSVTTEVDDQLKERLFELVEADLREAWGESRPEDLVDGAWAWLVFGPAGRRESALNVGQDNGLVYEDPQTDAEAERAAVYYAELAERVVVAMERCGYQPPDEGVTARAEPFRQPLAAWRAAYAQWAAAQDGDATSRAALCFDLRVLRGEDALGDALLETVREHLPNERLVRVLASAGVSTPLPLNAFNRFEIETGPDGREGMDLRRRALQPVVQMARAMAVDAGFLRSANTFDRLRYVRDAEHPASETARALLPAFATLVDFHLREQMTTAERGAEPTDRMDPGRLHQSQQNLLKEALKTVKEAQKRLGRLYGA